VFVEGGACAMAQWHNGQSKPELGLGGLRERCKLPRRDPGQSPAAEGFSCILSRQIVFPNISVRVAYSLHG